MSEDIWNGAPILATERLILRSFRRADVPLYQAMCADPVVMEFLGGTWTADYTEGVMASSNRNPATGGGMVGVERKADGLFLGAAGLGLGEQWYPGDMQLGWRLAPPHWGQGYACEAARAWMAHGFETLGRERLIAMADTPNLRSIAVMRRLGMQYDHEARLRDGDDEFNATIYAITRAQYAALAPQ